MRLNIERVRHAGRTLRGGQSLAVTDYVPRDCDVVAPEVQTLNLPLLKGEVSPARVTERFCALRIANWALRIAHYLMMSAIIPLASVASGMGNMG